MKKRVFYLVMMGLLSLQPQVMNASIIHDFPIVMVLLDEGGEPDPTMPARPHRAPAHTDILATYQCETGLLSLAVSQAVEVVSVQIYKDGILIIEDNEFVAGEYDLSVFGCGAYEIVITTADDVIYCSSMEI